MCYKSEWIEEGIKNGEIIILPKNSKILNNKELSKNIIEPNLDPFGLTDD